MSTMVVGVGGRGRRDWSIGPRVIARLAADPLVHALGVRLVVTTDLPGGLVHAAPAVSRLIVVRVSTQGGPPGAIHQDIVDAPVPHSAQHPSHAALLDALGAAGGSPLGGLFWLPRRVVVLTAQGCDLAPGRDATPGADEAVRRIVAMVRRELKVAPPAGGVAGPRPVLPRRTPAPRPRPAVAGTGRPA